MNKPVYAFCDILGINQEVLWKEGEEISPLIYDSISGEYVANPYLILGLPKEQ